MAGAVSRAVGATVGPLSTPTLASHLTWKQADIIVFLSDMDEGITSTLLRARSTAEISDFLQEIHAMDRHEGNVHYWGVDRPSTYGCLTRLAAREIVRQRADGQWSLTRKGAEAAESLT